ncbi:energy-coupling factor ABC transporter permease [Fervidicoccus fontis]|uniref:energy-coupling factor ABC transporter permease n=1 Tax=Fervidicoccus fontis TaxID=683846 RepID=UPI0023537C6C|nr:energy-coupling factor ABC transporter permease [Fervidicoccus fontis]
MHIPDGYLTESVWITCYVISLPIIIFSYIRLRSKLKKEELSTSFFAVITAAVFALQMVNYPLGPGGTTAHLIGTPLLSIIFGPEAGIVGLSIVLLIQALLFGDGGITTYGANTLNMAVTASVVSFFSYVLLRKLYKNEKGRIVAGAISGWLGIVSVAFMCGLELGLSKSTFGYGLSVTIPVMVISHAILGIVEGLVTGFAIYAIGKYRPDLLKR